MGLTCIIELRCIEFTFFLNKAFCRGDSGFEVGYPCCVWGPGLITCPCVMVHLFGKSILDISWPVSFLIWVQYFVPVFPIDTSLSLTIYLYCHCFHSVWFVWYILPLVFPQKGSCPFRNTLSFDVERTMFLVITLLKFAFHSWNIMCLQTTL